MRKRDSDTLLVGFDHAHGDIAVLIVGRKSRGETADIINQFQGEEAEKLYKKLIAKEDQINTAGLGELPQYHIDRDRLFEIVNGTVGYDRLMNSFDGKAVVGEEFTWFRNGDEFYILHLRSGMMINWYKHLGRANTCSQSKRTVDDYYTFFKLFKVELDNLEYKGEL